MTNAQKLAKLISQMSLAELEQVSTTAMVGRLKNAEPTVPEHFHENMGVMLLYDIRDAYLEK